MNTTGEGWRKGKGVPDSVPKRRPPGAQWLAHHSVVKNSYEIEEL